MTGELSGEERRDLLRLARAAIRDRLARDGALERVRAVVSVTPALEERRGAFVSLKIPSPANPGALELRGCIGRIETPDALHRTVVEVAEGAALRDSRFPPLTLEELSRVRIEVSALTALRSVGGPQEIEVGRDGVHLTRGQHMAVFLPQVATEQGWGVDRLLEMLALKAGLPRDGWRDAELATFRAEVFREGEDLRGDG